MKHKRDDEPKTGPLPQRQDDDPKQPPPAPDEQVPWPPSILPPGKGGA